MRTEVCVESDYTFKTRVTYKVKKAVMIIELLARSETRWRDIVLHITNNNWKKLLQTARVLVDIHYHMIFILQTGFCNLLTNDYKYSLSGGEIDCCTKRNVI
jgi:hypothetical protein